jgi:septum formation protein
MENSGIKLILASTSPRRRELLGYLGIPFEVLSRNVSEDSELIDPHDYVREIAIRKGAAVFELRRAQAPEQEIFVVSADTTVSLKGKIYAKPCDRSEARQFLSELAGQTHSVFTGVAVHAFWQGKEQHFAFVDESRVTFEQIGEELMETYLDTGDSLDKAGAYGIQGPSLTFISRVEGSYSNVVGLPLSRLVTETEKFFRHQTEGPWQRLFQR